MRLMDIKETCDYLRVSRDTLLGHVNKGRLVAYQPGGKNTKWFFKESDLEQFVNASVIGRFR